MEKEEEVSQKLLPLGTEQEPQAPPPPEEQGDPYDVMSAIRKRMLGNEDEEVHKKPRLSSKAETYAPHVGFAAFYSRHSSKAVTYAPEVFGQPSAIQSHLLEDKQETLKPPPPEEQETLPPPSPEEQGDPLQHFEVGKIINSRYEVVRTIGEGAHALVLSCLDHETWEYVAIKVPKITENVRSGKYEVKLLQRCAKSEASSRCVQFRDAFEFKNLYCIVFEMLGPSLHEFLELNSRLPVPVGLIRIFGRQLLEAVACLRDRKIIHTDLKPDNILLVSELKHHKSSSDVVQLEHFPRSNAIKLIDFGLSMSNKRRKKLKKRDRLPIVAARLYRAPEAILGSDWSYPIDIWSVGCIIFELCTGMPLLGMGSKYDDVLLATMKMVLGEFPDHMVRRISQATGKDWASNWESYVEYGHHSLQESVSGKAQGYDPTQLINLLHGLLRHDPSQRLTARQALEHTFFKNPHPHIDI